MALNIMSSLDSEVIQQSIITKNQEIFSSVSGVGAKLAVRIVNELCEKLKKKEESTKVVSNFSKTIFNDTATTEIYTTVFVGSSDVYKRQTLSSCEDSAERIIPETITVTPAASKLSPTLSLRLWARFVPMRAPSSLVSHCFTDPFRTCLLYTSPSPRD